MDFVLSFPMYTLGDFIWWSSSKTVKEKKPQTVEIASWIPKELKGKGESKEKLSIRHYIPPPAPLKYSKQNFDGGNKISKM